MFMGYEQRLLLMDRVIWDETTDHVIELDLSSSCLVGTIDFNSSLFQLSHLQRKPTYWIDTTTTCFSYISFILKSLPQSFPRMHPSRTSISHF
ncbi:hypothetical protein P3S68_032229 [Capsicum galapagoense]